MSRRCNLCASALLAGILLCVTGCARGGQSGGAAGSPAASGRPAAGDPNRGKTLYNANCSQCHGATGTEGGIGPSLRNERSRKDSATAIAWIKDPQPPMPKLYPGVLNERDVTDVAAYVESL